MKLIGCIGVILTLTLAQHAAAADLDTLWLCHDSIIDGSPEQLWFRMYLSDTFPDNRGAFNMVDTGNTLDGSKYINFDYQFGNPLPGYAGFKMYWDNGYVKFYPAKHDSLIFWHKGPLAGHKVRMVFAQGGECGGPINYQNFGEFKSSATWKRESFSFPEKRGTASSFPDSPFVKNGLFELRLLIYNDSSVTTSSTSEKASLKIDKMCFIKKATAGISSHPKAPSASAGNPAFFVPTVSGKVTLSIYSLQGEQLFRELVDVSAGQNYNVSRFAQKHSTLPARWISCVQITGAGVNITTKSFR